MDDRGYVAQALFDRLAGDGVEFRILGDARGYPERAPAEVTLAVSRRALAGMPRAIARFCRALDLQLVELGPYDNRAWRCVFAWSDEVGRPRFVAVRICSDYCRGPRCYLRNEDLLAGAPDVLFSHALIEAVEALDLPPERAAWLCSLWLEDPRGAIERIARFWPSGPRVRLLAQAAKHGDWTAVRAALPALRRALRRSVMPEPRDLAAWLAVRARVLLQPRQAAIAFLGREGLRGAVLAEVARDLAPLGLTLFEAGPHAPRADLRIEARASADATRQILRWLEGRVEQRYTAELVGDNPLAARLLQFACRYRLPLVQFFMNCHIRCRLDHPVLMPVPFGIVIDEKAQIGGRVTVMNQASLIGEVIVAENVVIGPGARIVAPPKGRLRIGRGATIGPNAVVTRDVPSHDTIVVEKRREDHRTVVNM